MSVTIVGGGWAGLAAGVQLSHQGIPVNLLEAAKQIGGRARCVPFGDLRVDNGQHVLLGSNSYLLGILKLLEIDESKVLQRMPLTFSARNGRQVDAFVKTADLPPPFNLFWGILRGRGLSIYEKHRAIGFFGRIVLDKFRIKQDVSVEALLIRHRQLGKLTDVLWEPLCYTTLHTPIRDASAHIFLNVLEQAFTQHSRSSDLLIPSDSLCKVFSEPAMEFIESKRGSVNLQKRLKDIHITDGKLTALEFEDETIETQCAILALPSHALIPIIKNKPELSSLQKRLQRLNYHNAYTVYLQFPTDIKLPSPTVSFMGTYAKWAFDRSYVAQPGLIAISVNAANVKNDLSHEEIEHHVTQEIAAVFRDWPKPVRALTIEESNARFASDVGINEFRPGNETEVSGLYISGDYTDTQLPATLEGAVMSGVRCGRLITKNRDLHGF